MRYTHFDKCTNITKDFVVSHLDHKVCDMEEAIKYYRQGNRVGILQHYKNSKAKVMLLDKESIFTTDLDYLVNCRWVVLL